MDIDKFLVDIKTRGFKCHRCGHKWVPRKDDKIPQICPKCKRRNWDKPRKIRITRTNKYLL